MLPPASHAPEHATRSTPVPLLCTRCANARRKQNEACKIGFRFKFKDAQDLEQFKDSRGRARLLSMSGASKKRGRAGASTKSYDMFNVSKK